MINIMDESAKSRQIVTPSGIMIIEVIQRREFGQVKDGNALKEYENIVFENDQINTTRID